MKYDEAQTRLASHANLPGTDLPETESFVWDLWNADRTGSRPNITELSNDIVACLKVANHELNGPVPSESVSVNRNRSVVSELAYSVSGIITSGLHYHRSWSRTGRIQSSVCNLLEDSIYKIAYAWDQVLAGDMDDILEGFDIQSAI